MRKLNDHTYCRIFRLSLFCGALLFLASGAVACLPNEAKVERSIAIKAPIAVVFENVNDLKKNAAWSPWAAHDPTMVTPYGEITRGVGASSSWTSDEMGSGSMRITESVPYSSILIDLDFKEEGTARSYWKFSELDGLVSVTWGFTSPAESFGEKFLALLMDSFVGPYYEEGLAKLKTVSEESPTN